MCRQARRRAAGAARQPRAGRRAQRRPRRAPAPRSSRSSTATAWRRRAGWRGCVGHFADPVVGGGRPPGAQPAGSGAARPLRRSAGAARPRRRRGGGAPRHAGVVRPDGGARRAPRARWPDPDPFDAALRYGEDVDLVWRLHDAGWRVRYDPRTVVLHAEPEQWSRWLERRHRYGTSAGPLALRHPARLTPLVLTPWPTAAWLLLAARPPAAGARRRGGAGGRSCTACCAPPACRGARRARTALRAAAQGVRATAAGLGGAGHRRHRPAAARAAGPAAHPAHGRRAAARAAAARVGRPPPGAWTRCAGRRCACSTTWRTPAVCGAAAPHGRARCAPLRGAGLAPPSATPAELARVHDEARPAQEARRGSARTAGPAAPPGCSAPTPRRGSRRRR